MIMLMAWENHIFHLTEHFISPNLGPHWEINGYLKIALIGRFKYHMYKHSLVSLTWISRLIMILLCISTYHFLEFAWGSDFFVVLNPIFYTSGFYISRVCCYLTRVLLSQLMLMTIFLMSALPDQLFSSKMLILFRLVDLSLTADSSVISSSG